jgi:hypothetical protein
MLYELYDRTRADITSIFNDLQTNSFDLRNQETQQRITRLAGAILLSLGIFTAVKACTFFATVTVKAGLIGIVGIGLYILGQDLFKSNRLR